MSGSHLCIPRNETVQPRYFQNRIIMFCLPIPTLIYQWEIYIFPGLVCLFAAAKYEDCSWEYWGRAFTFQGHKFDFRCSVRLNPENSSNKSRVMFPLQPYRTKLGVIRLLQKCLQQSLTGSYNFNSRRVMSENVLKKMGLLCDHRVAFTVLSLFFLFTACELFSFCVLSLISLYFPYTVMYR